MKLKDRYDNILKYFQENNSEAETELNYQSPFELLVAVVLSAQCTDVRVNKVTPNLFRTFPTPETMSMATEDKVFDLIRSISYPNSKAKYLVGLSKKIMDDFHGEIPLTVNELISLPGVGRKTANVITSVLDNQPNMAVDTHVFRVSHRLGLVSKSDKTPLAVEQKLIKHIPKELVHLAHHWLILHGRYICKSQNPNCANCPISLWCKHFEQSN